jgi:hypothetical protein
MGTWGAAAFDNDAALDWLAELEASTTDAVLSEAFHDVINEAEYIEVDSAQCAIAAAEVVAAFKGAASEHLPESAANWVLGQIETIAFEPLLHLALEALERLQADSEAAELWAEEGSGEWEREVQGLMERLAQE